MQMGTGKGTNLYMKLFGENPDATALLGFANLTRGMFGRYRDVFLADQGATVIVYTRIGGDNRNSYSTALKKATSHPQFIEDYDDPLDNTYAYFRYSVLPQYLETAKKMYKNEPMTIGDMFETHIARAKANPHGPEAKIDAIIADEMVKMLAEADRTGNHIMHWGDVN